MASRSLHTLSHALLGIHCSITCSTGRLSLHLLVLNEMQLHCRPAIEYYRHYYCSFDCKMLLDTICKDNWVPVKQQQLACMSAALPIQHGAMHHKTERPATCRQHCCDEQHFHDCPGSGKLQQVMHPTCITQHASQAADKGQQQQEQVPVSKAAVAVVRELIRGSGQQGTAVAASHHRGHHSGLVATLLLQELQVQLCGHRDLIASLV